MAGHYPAVRLGPSWWFNDSIEGMTRVSAASVQDGFVAGMVDLLRGHVADAAMRFQAVIDRGPLTMTEIDTGRIYSQVGRVRDAVPHLERAFAADATCAVYVEESPAFAPYLDDPALRALLNKYPRSRQRSTVNPQR